MKIDAMIIRAKALKEMLNEVDDNTLLLISVEEVTGNPLEWLEEKYLNKKRVE